MNYTPHEMRKIIRNCNTESDLRMFEYFLYTTEFNYYSLLVMYVFEQAILKQRLKIKRLAA
jgi:hypothetical protein